MTCEYWFRFRTSLLRSFCSSQIPSLQTFLNETVRQQQLRIRDLIPSISVTGQSYTYYREKLHTRGAGPVGEGTAKPQSNVTFEQKTDLVKKLAETRQELFNLRFQSATGALENTARMRMAKAAGATTADLYSTGLYTDAELKSMK